MKNMSEDRKRTFTGLKVVKNDLLQARAHRKPNERELEAGTA